MKWRLDISTMAGAELAFLLHEIQDSFLSVASARCEAPAIIIVPPPRGSTASRNAKAKRTLGLGFDGSKGMSVCQLIGTVRRVRAVHKTSDAALVARTSPGSTS
mmetsp:Transcript_95588/g.270467  ORF Transcript_95588/g.270467 Transcript_95588/m.270467 type:complete len:104 (-) Transcript_95588:614-925(-)